MISEESFTLFDVTLARNNKWNKVPRNIPDVK